jgi:hypothetical protein
MSDEDGRAARHQAHTLNHARKSRLKKAIVVATGLLMCASTAMAQQLKKDDLGSIFEPRPWTITIDGPPGIAKPQPLVPHLTPTVIEPIQPSPTPHHGSGKTYPVNPAR